MKKWSPLLIMFAAFLWSLDGLLRRKLYAIPASTLVMVEHIVGVLFLLPFFLRFWPEYKKMSKKTWGIIILTAVVGGFLGTVFYSAALAQVNYIKYSVVILLQKTQPIFAIALASIFLKERLTKQYIILALIGLFAAYIISFPQLQPNFQGQNAEVVAIFLALGAAICWGSATVLGKLVLHQLSFGAATLMRFLIVIPTAFGASLVLGQYYPVSQITLEQWLYFFGIALSCGTLAVLIYYKGLQYTPAKIATFAEMTFPISALFIGFFFLEERLTLQQIIAAIVLLGIILTLSLKFQESSEEKKQDN